MRGDGGPVRLADLLGRAFESLGSENVWLEVRVRKAWPAAVGDQVASRSRVLRLRKGCLEVGVWGDAWGTELRYLGGEIARRINELVGEQAVLEVVTRRERGTR